MKPEIQNCLTWLANAVADSCLHRVNPVNLDKDIRESWKQFNKAVGRNLDWKNLTIAEAKELRFRKWDTDSDLYLIPIWLKPMIPSDLELTSIGGDKAFADDVDTDTRFGCLAWGLILKEEQDADRA